MAAVLLGAAAAACGGSTPKDPAVSEAESSPAVQAAIARLEAAGWNVAPLDTAEVERFDVPAASGSGETVAATRVVIGAEKIGATGTTAQIERYTSSTDGEVVSVEPRSGDSAPLLWELLEEGSSLEAQASMAAEDPVDAATPSARADRIAGLVEGRVPDQGGDRHGPSMRMSGGRLMAVASGASASRSGGAFARLQAGAARGRELAMALPVSSTTALPELAQDGTVVYADDARELTLAVQGLGSSVRVLEVLSGPSAPTEYEFPVQLPPGGSLRGSESGGVVVLDANGVLRGGLAAPWAVDAAGRSVPTHYELRGDLVVQVIEHTGSAVQYPVVADPWLFVDLIDHATWRYTAGYGWTLQVAPTWWARANAGGYAVGVAGWNELYSKYKNHGLNTNLGGMRDQFICHEQWVAIWSPSKSTWNLDEWRPDVSYAATVNAKCNPGEPGGGKIID